MKRWLLLPVWAACVVLPRNASAHEVRPAYLEMRQTAPDTYEVLWKVPAQGDDRRLGIYVRLPAGARNLTEPHGLFAQNAYVERWRIQCPGGLDGKTVGIDGLAATKLDVLARIERAGGTTQTIRVLPGSPRFVVEATPSRWKVAATYLVLGVEHILGGIDHLLYILAMLLLIKGWKRVVATMTAFTATHSLTLTAAALGWVHVPQPPVEACIALSILFVTREIVCSRQGRPGLTERWPWVVSFTFGLLHGLGFAGALAEIGLPQAAIPVALLCFNLGVEVGQMLFVGAVLTAFALAVRVARSIGQPNVAPKLAWARFERVAAYPIGGVAAFWLIQRTLGLVR